jgi:hypothetical protein
VENQDKFTVPTAVTLNQDAFRGTSPKGFEARLLSAMARDTKPTGIEGELTGEEENSNLRQIRHAAKHGEITLLEIAPKTYFGFVDGRVKTHPLCIGDTLFIFVSRQNSLKDLSDLAAELVRHLPAEARWNGKDRSDDIDHIAHLF